MISLVPSESWGLQVGVGFCPKMGCGAMPRPVHLAGQRLRRRPDKCDAGRRPPSPAVAVARADDESLVPPQAAGLALSVARPLPTETASLGFGGSPVGGGDKNSHVIFFAFLCGGYHYPPAALSVSEQLGAGFISAEKAAFSEWVLCADERAVPSCTQRFFGTSMRGGYHITLGVRFMPLKRWTPAGHGGVFAVFMPPQCSPCAG